MQRQQPKIYICWSCKPSCWSVVDSVSKYTLALLPYLYPEKINSKKYLNFVLYKSENRKKYLKKRRTLPEEKNGPN